MDNLLKILATLDTETNTFIISHKTDVLDGKFENKSCVSWKIEDQKMEKEDLIIDGEYKEITDETA